MTYIKTIGLDLRFLNKNDNYSNFIFLLVKNLIKNTPDFLYNIYLNKSFLSLNFGENTKNNITNILPGTLNEQFKFSKILNKNNNDLVIFFNYKNPISYNKKNILFLKDLSNTHFPKRNNIFKKMFLNTLFNRNLKKASKIIVFDNFSKEELNDKFNIHENKIAILKAFFNKIDKPKKENLIDFKTKYNIKGPFFIYSSGDGNQKNLDKLIDTFNYFDEKNINLNLLILDNKTIKNVDFRKQVIEKKLTNKIYFIGETNNIEKDYFYSNSIGEIYPLLYSSFPFSLNTAINYDTPIFSSNLKIIKNIFGEKIQYFNPNNGIDIINKLMEKQTKKSYNIFLKNYNINNTTKDLINVINGL